MDLNSYLASLKGKSVAVVGIGVSNRPLIDLLLDAGIEITACDKNPRESFGTLAQELESRGVKLQFGGIP